MTALPNTDTITGGSRATLNMPSFTGSTWETAAYIHACTWKTQLANETGQKKTLGAGIASRRPLMSKMYIFTS